MPFRFAASLSSLSPRRRATFGSLAAALILWTFAAPLHAADAYPSHPVTLVIPFAPGGTTDIIGRLVGQKLGEELHQPVVIDNRAGAGGTIAGNFVAHAAPDGYTLLLATIAHSIAPAIYKSLSYDFQKDLDPIGLVALTPNVVIVNPQLKVKTVAELIAYIKAHPNQVTYGSAGIGSTEHLSGQLFASMIGVPMTHVPYKGGAPMMTDLIAGQIQTAIETSPSASQHVRSGAVVALAVTTKKRSPAYPGVPTLDEAGVKGYDVTTWFSLMAPHNTPKAVEDHLVAALTKVLHDPEIQKRFEEQGVSPGDMTPKQLATFIGTETTEWGKVAKSANIAAE
jgi:tripartite-type tricarboxylate transporter receptor subunit TctC